MTTQDFESGIQIDTREPWEDFVDAFNRCEVDFDVFVEKLDDKADFLIRNNGRELAIQRKRVNDFANSIDSLKNTMHILRTNYENTALLIERDWTYGGTEIAVRRGRKKHRVMGMDQWHNFILSQQFRGSMYIRTTDLYESTYAMKSAHSWLGKDLTVPTSHIDDPSVILQMIPGIGPKTCERLIATYGDALSAMQCIDSWDDVDGIGEKTKSDSTEWMSQ